MKRQSKFIAPWINRLEVKRVYEELYSDDEVQQLHAVGRIFVWKSRVLHKLPVAIDSTASLIMAVVELKNAKKLGLVQENQHKLQSALSLALIRFVNHITEKGQTRHYAQPVHVLAAELGVPEWVVELRHSATHGSLPPLSMLKAAVNCALGWLKTEFWENQVANMSCVSVDEAMEEEEDNSGNDEENVRTALKTYQAQKLKEFQRQQDRDKTADQRNLNSLEKLFVSNRTVAISCLLEDGCLIPTPQQLKELQIQVESLGARLPLRLVKFWKPVLGLLQHLKSTSMLLKHMVSMVTTEITYRNQILSAWIYTILAANDNAVKQQSRHNMFKLYKSSTNLQTKMLLEACIKIPSLYTAPVIKLLISQQVPPLPEKKIQRLTHLMNLLTKEKLADQCDQVETNHDGKGKLHTLSDILVTKEMGEETRNTVCEDLNMSSTQWKLCTDAVDWSKIPIGCLPGQKVGYCNLEFRVKSNNPSKPLEESTYSGNDEEMMETEFHDLHEREERCWDNKEIQSSENDLNMWTQKDMVKLKEMVELL